MHPVNSSEFTLCLKTLVEVCGDKAKGLIPLSDDSSLKREPVLSIVRRLAASLVSLLARRQEQSSPSRNNQKCLPPWPGATQGMSENCLQLVHLSYTTEFPGGTGSHSSNFHIRVKHRSPWAYWKMNLEADSVVEPNTTPHQLPKSLHIPWVALPAAIHSSPITVASNRPRHT